MHPTNCLNCGQTIAGQFCGQCGQKEVHRYTVGHVLHELVHVFTHADKGIFSFAKNILIKPGTVALDLVEGRRKRYFNLFQYLLLIVGFTTFLVIKANFMGHVIQNVNTANGAELSKKLAAIQSEVGLLMQKYNNILQMLLIPVFAFFSWLLIGRQKKYNFAEVIVLHTASSAQTNTLGILTLVPFLISDNNLLFTVIIFVSFAIMIFSFSLCYRQFYKLSVLKSVLYGILVIVCTYVIQTILTAIFFLIYAVFSGVLK
jgi:Protein of unknown function (DUF3667)